MARRRMEVEQGLWCPHVVEWLRFVVAAIVPNDSEIGRGQRAVAVGDEDGNDHIEGGVGE